MDVPSILAELDDHGFDSDSPTSKLAAINFAIKNICHRKAWPFLEKILTLEFDGTSATPTNAPADLRAVMKMMDTVTGRRIRFMRTDDMEEQYASELEAAGEPYFYYFEGTALKLWKVPAETQTLRLRYIKSPALVTETGEESTIAIPPDYHEAIIFRALMRLYDKNDDPELAARFEAHYENVLFQMSVAMAVQQLDEPEYIHVVDDDDYGYDL